MFTVNVTEKGGSPKQFEFDKDEVTIGRVPGNDIILPKGNVSKRHSRIVRQEGRYFVVDLKSTNGTYLNGRRITTPSVIRPGDKIYVGDFVVTVEMGEGMAALDEPLEDVEPLSDDPGGDDAPMEVGSMLEGVDPLPLDEEPSLDAPPGPPMSPSIPRMPAMTATNARPPVLTPSGMQTPGALAPPPMSGGQNANRPTQPPPRAPLGSPRSPSAPPPMGGNVPMAAPIPPAPLPSSTLPGPGGRAPLPTGPIGRPPGPPLGGLPPRPGSDSMSGFEPPRRPSLGGLPPARPAEEPLAAPNDDANVMTPVPAAPAVTPAPIAAPSPFGAPPSPFGAPPLGAPPSALAPTPAGGMQPMTPMPAMPAPALPPMAPATMAPPMASPPIAPAPPMAASPLATPPSAVPVMSNAPALAPAPAAVAAPNPFLQPPVRTVADSFAVPPRGAVQGTGLGDGRDTLGAMRDLFRLGQANGFAIAAGQSVDANAVAHVRSSIEAQARRRADLSNPANLERVVRGVSSELTGTGALSALLDDPTVQKIVVEGSGRVLSARGGSLEFSGAWFSCEDAILLTLDRLLASAGTQRTEGQSLVQAMLADDVQLTAILRPLSTTGPSLVLERAQTGATTLSSLVESGTLTSQAAQWLDQAVHAHRNIIVAGGAGSGRTTVLAALYNVVSQSERAVVIETHGDVGRRLRLPSFKPSAMSIAGRLGAHRWIVDDVTAENAVETVSQLVTGFEGALVAALGASGSIALDRLATMAHAARGGSREDLLHRLASTRPVVVQVSRLGDGRCRVTSIGEARVGDASRPVVIDEAFVFRAENRAGESVQGQLVAMTSGGSFSS